MSEDSTEIKEVSTVRKDVGVPTPAKRSWRIRREERQKKRRERRKHSILKNKSAKEIIHQQQTWVSRVLFFLLAGVIVFPFVLLLHRVFSVTGWVVPALAGLAATAGLFFLLRKIKFTVWTIIGLSLIVLSVTSVIGKYSYVDLCYDYVFFLNNISDERKSMRDVFLQRPFPKYWKFNKAAIVTTNVRQYSLKAATKNFSKYQNARGWQYVQYFSIYKEIESKWKYVSDPANRDYIASADESLETFCGDCDDYSVLMAACITAVGGTVRLVRTESHVYPELKIESQEDFELVQDLIRTKLFSKMAKNKMIYSHEDAYGDIWINLDYTDHYPGAKFMSDDIVAVLEIKYREIP